MTPRRHFGRAAWLLATAAALLALAPARALAVGHVAMDSDTDLCAMCHRTHTAASGAWYRPGGSLMTTRSALIVSTFSTDTELCYACHGTSSDGSNSNVETPFESTSHHSLAPTSSPFGPSPKECSDCHDSHGSTKTVEGTTYPALLRSRGAAGTAVFSGEEYCATCHTARPASEFGGLAIYRQTAHYTKLPAPATGTNIRCSICHDPHGSSNTALVAPQLTPPAVTATYTVAANDRRFCAGCHAAAYGTFPGAGASYAQSGHGESTVTVPIKAEYASAEASRAVGECQVCHDPMGRDDGTGKPIPKLANKAGTALCYQCHSVGGAAKADLQSVSFGATSTVMPGIVAAYSPTVMTGSYGRVSAYSQDERFVSPRPIVGPREFATGYPVGRMAAGDVNGDGSTEVVVADPSTARLSMLKQDPQQGFFVPSGGTWSIAATADAIGIADIFTTSDTQRPVIAVATGTTAGKLYLYRLGDSGLDQLGSPIDIGDGPYSIAPGNVTGGSGAEFVVASYGSNQIRVIKASATPDVADVAGPYATPNGPVSVSVGDVWQGQTGQQIVVACDSGSMTVMSGDGSVLGTFAATGLSGTKVTACAVGDFLPAYAGSEIVVAIGEGTSTGTLLVFPQDSNGGLLTPHSYSVPAGYNPGSLVAGDVDGDGKAELIVGNAGSPNGSAAVCSPSIQVYQATSNGQDLGAIATYPGGGTELAGRAPDMVVADLAKLGPSRHPVEAAAADSHVSTETSPFTMHVACTDCHEVHQANETTADAPAVYGALKGAMGVSVNNVARGDVQLTGSQTARYEFEVCFKCHSVFSGASAGGRDLSQDFNPLNASVHMVEPGTGTSNASASSFATAPAGHAPWTNSSVLYCKDCHGDSDHSDPAGPHASNDAPILNAPYLGVAPSDADGLCYRCHKYQVYFTGDSDSGDSASNFYSTTPALKLHSEHVSSFGLGCAACHVSHGSAAQRHLIRTDVGYTAGDAGGTCDNGCHSAPKTYTR